MKKFSEQLEEQKIMEKYADFLEFCAERLGLEELPEITLINDKELARENKSFGGYRPYDQTIETNIAERHMADVFRTLAHELVHHKQNLDNRLDENSGETGSDIENEANAMAGILMREYARETEGNIFEEVIHEGNGCHDAGPGCHGTSVDPDYEAELDAAYNHGYIARNYGDKRSQNRYSKIRQPDHHASWLDGYNNGGPNATSKGLKKIPLREAKIKNKITYEGHLETEPGVHNHVYRSGNNWTWHADKAAAYELAQKNKWKQISDLKEARILKSHSFTEISQNKTHTTIHHAGSMGHTEKDVEKNFDAMHGKGSYKQIRKYGEAKGSPDYSFSLKVPNKYYNALNEQSEGILVESRFTGRLGNSKYTRQLDQLGDELERQYAVGGSKAVKDHLKRIDPKKYQRHLHALHLFNMGKKGQGLHPIANIIRRHISNTY